MDYLNYGNKVQQKPQKFVEQKPQGFGKQKVKLTKNDFSFGDLNHQTTQPQVAPQTQVATQPQTAPQTKETKDDLIQMFPTPVLICPCPIDYSKELEWIKKQNFKRENKPNEIALNHQSEDTFILDKPEMSRVKQFIDSKLKEFVVNVMGSDSEIVITQSWLNRNCKGDSHHQHIHPNSMISGVWYPQIHEQLPPIEFKNNNQRDISLPIKKFNYFNSTKFLLPMKMGELILFPSNVPHSVPPNQSDEERISLSFNTWGKGNMGSIDALTYLPIDRCV